MGAGLRASGGAENTSVLADAFEAFVAAVFLRYGLDKTRRFLLDQHVEPAAARLRDLVDPKTRLQHYSQEHLAATPSTARRTAEPRRSPPSRRSCRSMAGHWERAAVRRRERRSVRPQPMRSRALGKAIETQAYQSVRL